jgi:hypothetical protein
MMGEAKGIVLEITPFELHGVRYADVAVKFDDTGAIDSARLGPEAVPDGLKAGDTVLAMRAANMIISLRRPEP